MILAMNVLGWLTLIIGFSGIFSVSVPKWMALIVMAMGALTMFSSWSNARARPFEPLAAGLVLVLVAVFALISSDARSWFPGMVLVAALAQAAAGFEGLHLINKQRIHGANYGGRGFFWRRFHGDAVRE